MKKGLVFKSVLLTAVLALALSACGKGASSGGGAASGGSAQDASGSNTESQTDIWAKYAEPVKVNIGRHYNAGTQWPDGESWTDNFQTRWFKDNMNIELEFTLWSENPDEMLTLAIVSGDIPDIVVFEKQQTLAQLINNGLIADLTDVFEQYMDPLVRYMVDSSDGVFEAISGRNGRLYSLAMDNSGGLYPDVMFIREDWLKLTGLPAPKTLDELNALALKFIEMDLAGDGQTVGIEVNNWIRLGGDGYNQTNSLSPIFALFNNKPAAWIPHPDGSGKIVYSSTLPGAKQGLAVLADMYQQGILDKEFATKDFCASIASGNAGICFGPAWIPVWPLRDCLNNFDEAIYKGYPVPYNGNGKYYVLQQSDPGYCSAVRKDYAHPEVLVKLFNASTTVRYLCEAPSHKEKYYEPLQVLADYRMGKMNNDWQTFPLNTWTNDVRDGIEGGLLAKSMVETYDKGETFDLSNIPPANAAGYQAYVDFLSNVDTSAQNRESYALMTGNAALGVESSVFDVTTAFVPFPTDTMAERGADLYDLEMRAFLQIVIGEQPLDYFDEFVAQWYAQGGQIITDEINAQAQARK